MRASLAILAGAIAIGVAACSRPAEVQPDPELEHAFSELFENAQPIASDVEVHRPVPPTPEPEQPATVETPRRAVPQPQAPAAVAVREPEAAEAEAPQADAPLHDDHAAHPRAGEEVGGPRVATGASGGGKPDIGVIEGAGRVPDRGRGVLIRGGVITIDDDCAEHPGHPGRVARPDEPLIGVPGTVAEPPPQTGTVGVLINDRSPRNVGRAIPQAPRDRGRNPVFPRGGIR